MFQARHMSRQWQDTVFDPVLRGERPQGEETEGRTETEVGMSLEECWQDCCPPHPHRLPQAPHTRKKEGGFYFLSRERETTAPWALHLPVNSGPENQELLQKSLP